MISDILELTKIEAGKIELKPEPVDPAALLNDIADILRPRAEQAGLVLQVQTANLPARVWADVPKLRQVLHNLVTNAIKFTPAGQVILSAGARSDGNSTAITFHVSDTGIGIAPADQRRIFEPFVQLNTGVSSAGTGLGLAICQQYVDVLGGTLSLNSIPGQGTRVSFSLRLPTGQTSTAPVSSPSTGETPPLRGCRALIVDDTPEMRMLLRDLLEPLAMDISEASNGEVAITQIIDTHPHVVLLDWRLPGMSGIDITRRVRQQSALPQPFIVMLTAHAYSENRAEAEAAGVDAFMTKPVDIARLKTLLQQHWQTLAPAEKPQEQTPAPTPDSATTKALIARLSEPTRQQMSTALRELNPAKLKEAIDAVHEENAPLAARLAADMHALRYRTLWQLFDISGT